MNRVPPGHRDLTAAVWRRRSIDRRLQQTFGRKKRPAVRRRLGLFGRGRR